MTSTTRELSKRQHFNDDLILPTKTSVLKSPPLDVLPRELREFIEIGAESLNCPTDFLFMPLLTIAGAAIGGSRAAVPKPGWREFPVLWTGIIGSPAAGKTPAINLVAKPLKDEQMKLVRKHETHMMQYNEELKQWSANKRQTDKPDEPLQEMAFTSDSTTETLRDLLAERPKGVVMLQDELAGWVRSFNQYKTAGNDRQMWLSIWSAEMAATARKTSRVVLERPIVPVLGGLQPDVLPVLMTEGRDGFLPRILFIYPERVQLRYSNTTLPDNLTDAWARYYRDLNNLSGRLSGNQKSNFSRNGKDSGHLSGLSGVGLQEIVEMPFTDAANRIVMEWLNDVHLKEINIGELSPILEDAWSKLRSYLMRLSLILQAIWHINGELSDRRIDFEAVLQAISIIEYLKSHIIKTYDSLQVDPDEMYMQSILSWAKRKVTEKEEYELNGIPYRDIQRSGTLPKSMNKSSKIKELLVSIKDHGYARVDDNYTLFIA